MVILTALSVEYAAVRSHLTDVEPLVHPSGTRAERGRLAGTPWYVALAEIGEGTLTAAALTERFHTWLRPQALLFVGVAGGLKDDIAVGDVVVATKVYGIHGGKQSPQGFLVRPEAWRTSHRLEQAARHALRGHAHFKPIAVGDVVLADAASAIARHLHEHYNDAVAIEMEGTGVLQAAQLTGELDVLIIRGISDKADAYKHERDAAGSQPLAAQNAARAVIALLREFPIPQNAGSADGSPHTVTGGIVVNVPFEDTYVRLTLPPRDPTALAGLPDLSPVFTGRDNALDDLLGTLQPGGAEGQQPVLVRSVSGLAGIGKTELVAQAAAQALRRPDWFSGGMLFTDLNGYDPTLRVSAETVLTSWLRALNIPDKYIPEGLESLQSLYRTTLSAFARQGQRVLVIVDNASSADQARPLLPVDGFNAALVTSRHTLDLGARLLDLGILGESHAIDLLAQVLHHALGADDTRVADAPQAARNIARLCAGLPLALRIVGALLADAPARPLTDIAEALQAEHSRLDELQREERAVRAAFDLSYHCLDEIHSRLFRLLPLNPGPDLSTEAAARLADTDSPQVKRLLTDLARAHLVEHRQPWGRRWGMHALVRLYADEQGRTHDDADQRHRAQARLFSLYLDDADAADTHLTSLPDRPRSPRFRNRDDALQWLDAEHAGLIATATAAPALGHPHITAHLVITLARYLNHRRRFEDWITITNVGLTLFRTVGDRQGEATALNNLGLALRKTRRFDEAIDAHTQATDLYHALHDGNGEATALTNRGSALTEARRFEEAIDAYTHAIELHQDRGDQHRQAMALGNLGSTLNGSGRSEEAIDSLTRAVDLFHDLGDPHEEATALDNLGGALQAAGRLREAIDAHTRAIELHQDLGNQHGEAAALINLGLSLTEAERCEEAVDAHTRAIELYQGFGDRHGEATALDGRGRALHRMRRFEEAIDAHTRAAHTQHELGDRYREALALDNLGLSLAEVERSQDAVYAHTLAAELYKAVDSPTGEALARGHLGSVLYEAGRLEEALTTLTRAAGLFRALDDRGGEATTLGALGSMLYAAGRFEESTDPLIRAASLFQSLGDRSGEATALTSLGSALHETLRMDEAIAPLTRAAGHFQALDDRGGEARALASLGLSLTAVGRLQEAVDTHSRAVGLFRSLGDQRGEATTLTSLGSALAEAQRFEEALGALTRAAELHRDSGDRHSEAMALANLGSALHGVGQPHVAVNAYVWAGDRFRAVGDQHGEATTLGNLGGVLAEVQRFEEAIAPLTRAAGLFHALGDRPREATALARLGVSLSETRRSAEAATALEQALDIHRLLARDSRSDHEPDIARLLLYLASLGTDGEQLLPGTLAAAREASELFTRLATVQPAAFSGLAAASLMTLAEVLERLGRTEDAERVRQRLAGMEAPHEQPPRTAGNNP
ncbi:tetratricopeptide repeat protein [Streptomyces sp. NPDC005017]|uniref:tetratricopeptide repeat protein n=1 Tax=Streptomyces sp. NPDC005017 TaxID=3364706 RepID=UPI0036B3C6ED